MSAVTAAPVNAVAGPRLAVESLLGTLLWLTGFAGSWGMAILTVNKGAIFVDGRYTIQVRQQVDTKLFTPHHLVDEGRASGFVA